MLLTCVLVLSVIFQLALGLDYTFPTVLTKYNIENQLKWSVVLQIIRELSGNLIGLESGHFVSRGCRSQRPPKPEMQFIPIPYRVFLSVDFSV